MVRNFHDRGVYIQNAYKKKYDSLSPILEQRRKNKFKRDNIDFNAAVECCSKFINKLSDIEKPNQIVNNNQHHPIIINQNQHHISDNFKDLCAKGPSFIPTPQTFDWLKLQKDFDNFSHRLRCRHIFQNSMSQSTSTSIPQPPRTKSKWRAPKTNNNELESFLSNMEKSLFENTSRKRVSNNLERKAFVSYAV